MRDFLVQAFCVIVLAAGAGVLRGVDSCRMVGHYCEVYVLGWRVRARMCMLCMCIACVCTSECACG